VVRSPNALSLSAESVRTSSAELVFFTATLYLTVAQAASVATKPFVVVAVLGASDDVTVTLLEPCENVELVLRVEWPYAVTVSVSPDTFSPTVAVKVHVPVAPCCPAAASGPGGQLPFVAVMPLVPAGHAAPVKPAALKMVP
jgi:hypothetical protein